MGTLHGGMGRSADAHDKIDYERVNYILFREQSFIHDLQPINILIINICLEALENM